MKKTVLLFAALLLFFSCTEKPENYSTLILGSWEVTDVNMEIRGVTGDTYEMVKETMNEKLDFIGEIFIFQADNVVSAPMGDGLYHIDGNRLQIVPEQGGTLNFTIISLNNRSLVLTYDAKAEQPMLSLLPGLTKCLATITASKNKQPAAEH